MRFAATPQRDTKSVHGKEGETEGRDGAAAGRAATNMGKCTGQASLTSPKPRPNRFFNFTYRKMGKAAVMNAMT